MDELETATLLAADALDDRLRAVALYEDGMLAFWQGADEAACSLHGRSLHLARRLGDKTTIALALCGLARVALREDLDWARTLCEEALAVVDGTNDRMGRANALHVLELAARMRGDLPDRMGWAAAHRAVPGIPSSPAMINASLGVALVLRSSSPVQCSGPPNQG